jgi:hypothetical protein
MHGFRQETEDFKTRKSLETAHARQIAALHLACGIDLSEALSAGPAEKLRLAARLERAIERERLKGLCRHWSYDLNRHIALKQGLDRLRGTEAAPRRTRAGKQNGAQRRRRKILPD